MKALVQRVSSAEVTVDGEAVGRIGQGLLVLAGFGRSDGEKDLKWMTRKLTSLRIFPDNNRDMNLSVIDVEGSILLVSQFTLHADTRKGNRPGFSKAAPPEEAEMLYKLLIEMLSSTGVPVQTGSFGAMMKVSLINDGPVTIMLNSPSEED